MSTPRPLWQGRTLAVVGIVLFAFSLRSAVASLSPLFDHISAEFDLPAAVIGLIGTAPPVCFAVFGLLTPALERRFGLERLAVAAMVVVALGLVARSLAPDAGLLLAGTALVFAAVGTGNILLPPLVKRYFPDRIGLMTTVYSTTMAVSTSLPALIAVPVADAADWHLSLGLWSVFALAGTIPWIGLAVRRRAEIVAEAAAADPVRPASEDVEGPSPRAFGRMWRVPLAWGLLVTFAASATMAYTSFAWLPKMLVDIAGVTPAAAGGLLSLFGFMGLPASLAVPLLVARANATRLLIGIAIASGFVGLGGLLLAPAAAPWLWVALFGLAPLLFPLVLVLLGLRTRTHEGAVALSGFVQSIGYGIAALFPLGIGLLHDATDSWTGPLIVLVLVVAAVIPAGAIAARPHTVEDEWERRHGAW
ncbi:CynX/NimT family MFS transporter [Microbacterium kyungheense]|uniref:CP family cyanate transporter-like MFS transporter n=1 Tax=Microbacterium kyungheense TaxID=1263636 RepID=A0A543ES43_9MICO|nr:MFS transporter [Microbacterium kyungheense]TQM24401.1 CP family cyanate transporter-like MFS transporter [Microbacterium kyungheense]